jgi:ADP-dependent NAD(P)H-hydrate dehydratase / NAD(P)H-hydrate epimerase
MRTATREEIVEIDRRATSEFGIPAATLMENAGRAVAALVLREFQPRCAAIVCGKGKNGGDGRIVARLLSAAGVEVRVHDAVTGPAPAGIFDGCSVVVDALFGTGLSREVTGGMRALIEQMNAHVPVVAVDIPSGLDANTGRPLGVAVRAAVTVTMGLAKVGLLKPEAAPYVGRLVIADIGYPAALVGG